MVQIHVGPLHPVAEAVDTPWGDRNRRFGLTDDFQLTLFEAGDS